jgi:oligopeptide/dipeptide ABC transporter ATP-binding protein
VKSLKTYFFTGDGVVKAVDGANLTVYRGEVLGLVGESGCGKSVTSLSIMRLIEAPGKMMEGEILFDGMDLAKLPEQEMIKIRGDRISMIFQQPQSSLNPVFKIGDQIAEVLGIHQRVPKGLAWNRAVELLGQVGIPDPDRKAHAYPYELSGGQAQRVMIAMALALNPQLLIADEPTTALDVTIQAQILDLIRSLSREMGTAVILVTHDLGVIAEMADRVAVMYAGRIVEETGVVNLFERPLHPYTQGLIASIPVLGKVKERLDVIPGSVPNLVDLPPGCKFASRCRARVEHSLEICMQMEPDLVPVLGEHAVRCWLYLDHGEHRAPLHLSSLQPSLRRWGG